MSECSADTHLVAARELLLSVGQQYTSLPAEQQAHIQEAVEHINQVEQSMERNR